MPIDEDDKGKIILYYDSDNITDVKNSAKPIYLRGRSLSFSAPIHKTVYSDLPQSPATKFLSEFSHTDDFYEIPEFEEGTAINNYLVGQILGGGAYSECREAYVLAKKNTIKEHIPDKVALKIITDPRYLVSFKRELEIWSKLDHPNILPLIDSFSSEGYIVGVSVLAENGNLQSYISRNGKLTENLAKRLFKQLSLATLYLHDVAGVAHLDIKLENILIKKSFDIYLCDFGMSFCIKIPKVTEEIGEGFDGKDQFCCGSLTSLPPEMFSTALLPDNPNSEETNFWMKKKQDVWALGIVLYAMISGKLPFSDDFIPRLQHSIVSGDYAPLHENVAKDLNSLIASLLSKNPSDRPSLKEILESPWLN